MTRPDGVFILSTGVYHYAAACSTGLNSYNPFFHVFRPIGIKRNDPSTYGQYKSVKATATVTNLDPCTGATASNNGWSMVNVVNTETFEIAGGAQTYAFVQLGYAQQACAAGNCQSGRDPDHPFSPYVTDFWYTARDTDGGWITKANWVDFTGDGNYDPPHEADRYTFSIDRLSATLQWQLCIEVVSSSVYTVGSGTCHLITRSTNGYMNEIYWGAETYNDASAIGKTSGSDLNISPMQYKNSNGSIYTTVTNATCSRTRLDGGIPWLSQQCGVTESGGASHLNIWTNLHN